MAGQEKQGVRNIHLPKYIVKGYPEDDDSNENAIKAKHARIADMFLARPAAQDVKIDVPENSSQDVKMTRKQKKQKKKGKKYDKDKEKTKKAKKLKKVEQNQNTTDVEEQNNQVPDGIITVIEEGIEAKEAGKILSCFDFIRSWYSKKKQKRQEKRDQNRLKRQEKKERKRLKSEEKRNRRKGLPIVTVAELHEAPSTHVNDDNEGTCGVDDVMKVPAVSTMSTSISVNFHADRLPPTNSVPFLFKFVWSC